MVVRIDARSDGRRVDAFLAEVWNVSAAEARRRWAEAAVRVEGRPARKGERLLTGATVEFQAAVARPPTQILPDEAVELQLLYSDVHLVAVNKPAGIAGHPLRFDERGTAANALVARFPECREASTDAREGGLVHRLDAGTSGVLVAARSRAAWMALRRTIGADDCEKHYLAEVLGHPPTTGRIEAAIGRAGRRGGTVRVDGGGRQPLAAETEWRVVSERSDTALLVATLHRGRPHQVRAHLAAAGFPIVGDTRYGAPLALPVPGFRLHAWKLRFVHPLTAAALDLSAPLPAWAQAPGLE